MALVTTPGADNATSYADVASALARAALDVRGTTFAGLETDGEREPLLAMATLDIDAALLASGRQRGCKYRETQALEQPRETGILATTLVIATQLLAFHLADRQSLGEIGTPVADTRHIRRDKTGPLETEYFAPTTLARDAFEALPAHVQAYLTPLLMPAGASWGTGTVARGA